MASTPNPPAQGAPADQAPAAGSKQVLPTVPFVRGALPNVKRAKQFKHTVTLSADVQPLPTLSVPTNGFLRSVILRLTLNQMTGGTYSADGLAAALRSANFADTGGSDVIAPLRGHDLKMLAKWMPFGGFSDPAVLSVSATEMYLRLPLEISERDGLGCLPNMDASSLYTCDISVGTLADIFTDNPDAAPQLTVEAFVEGWTPPVASDFPGRQVEVQPPALNTTQYVSKNRPNIPAPGDHNLTLERRGNLTRGILFIGRNEAGERSDSVLPESFRLTWDGRELFDMPTALQRYYMRERGGQAVDTGVLLVDFSHEFDGRLGAELRDQWLRTLKSSDLSLDLTGVAAAGQLSIITIDVAPTGNIYVTV